MTDADVPHWSDTAPTQPGYYWLSMPGHALVVTEVLKGRAAFGSGWMPAKWLCGARWAGPIHPPVDTAEERE